MTIAVESLVRRVQSETHLDAIDLTIPPGLNVLLGRTFAGKTTLLRVLAGLDRPTEGRILEDGRDVTGVPVNRRDVAIVYQQFVNYPSFTVYDNIAAPLRRRGMRRAEVDGRVRAVAATVRIDHLLDRLPGQLSGGQQQRVAIARALAKEARLLLLDEPLVNLDYKLREEMRSELRGLFHGGGRIVVYATTEPEEALQMGGSVIVLSEGRVLQTGPTEAVYRAPASTTVAQIVSEPPINIVPAWIGEGKLAFAGGRLPVPLHVRGRAAGEVRVGVRPHQVRLVPAPGALALAGTVTLAEVDGSSTFTHFAAGGADWIVQHEGVHPVHPGTRLDAYVDPADLYLFGPDGALVAAPEAR